jgi:hypothetical protein
MEIQLPDWVEYTSVILILIIIIVGYISKETGDLLIKVFMYTIVTILLFAAGVCILHELIEGIKYLVHLL